MTRYTNLGRKRSYVEAGFETQEPPVAPVQSPQAQIGSVDIPEGTVESDPKPPKKKRKRGKSRKGKETAEEGDDGASLKEIQPNGTQDEPPQNAKQRKKAKFKEKQKQREKGENSKTV